MNCTYLSDEISYILLCVCRQVNQSNPNMLIMMKNEATVLHFYSIFFLYLCLIIQSSRWLASTQIMTKKYGGLGQSSILANKTD